jgi:hypothetical protein
VTDVDFLLKVIATGASVINTTLAVQRHRKELNDTKKMDWPLRLSLLLVTALLLMIISLTAYNDIRHLKITSAQILENLGHGKKTIDQLQEEIYGVTPSELYESLGQLIERRTVKIEDLTFMDINRNSYKVRLYYATNVVGTR